MAEWPDKKAPSAAKPAILEIRNRGTSPKFSSTRNDNITGPHSILSKTSGDVFANPLCRAMPNAAVNNINRVD